MSAGEMDKAALTAEAEGMRLVERAAEARLLRALSRAGVLNTRKNRAALQHALAVDDFRDHAAAEDPVLDGAAAVLALGRDRARRPRAETAEQHRDIAAFVHEQQQARPGAAVTAIHSEAAERFGVTERTVRRACDPKD